MLSIAMCAMAAEYIPSEAVRESQRQFEADRFGIFIHWGIYSMFGQGEWYLNYGPLASEYMKAAKGFYPADFDANQWVDAIKDSGAKYICITSRHHDGFSMWKTAESDYNIVDGTPFKRDVLKELSQACAEKDIKLHFYYSHLDWVREDYPQGRTGHSTGRDGDKQNWESYYAFMNRQLTELLTGYGPIRAIWFDGWWDHDSDSVPFDWQLEQQYALIHNLQPACMVGNNHHQAPFPGEDIQIFERDVPGENSAGLSGQEVSRLPLETCNTMNGMWGYKVVDTDYKDVPTHVRYLVRTAGLGANLLLNIGPQPDGTLPALALERLKGMGEWMRRYGDTIYGTTAGDIKPCEWGATTRKGDKLYVHVTDPSQKEIMIPGLRVKKALAYDGGEKIAMKKSKEGTLLSLPEISEDCIDYIVELTTD